MAEFQKIREETRNYGSNSYIEVATKRLREDGRETQFLLVSRGFYERDGSKRWTKFITLPMDVDLTAWVAVHLAIQGGATLDHLVDAWGGAGGSVAGELQGDGENSPTGGFPRDG